MTLALPLLHLLAALTLTLNDAPCTRPEDPDYPLGYWFIYIPDDPNEPRDGWGYMYGGDEQDADEPIGIVMDGDYFQQMEPFHTASDGTIWVYGTLISTSDKSVWGMDRAEPGMKGWIAVRDGLEIWYP